MRLDLSLIHVHYDSVLNIQKRKCSLVHAMESYGPARNTLRDFIGICELKIIHRKKYNTITGMVRETSGKNDRDEMQNYPFRI